MYIKKRKDRQLERERKEEDWKGKSEGELKSHKVIYNF